MEAEESDRNGATSPQRTAERAGQGAACQWQVQIVVNVSDSFMERISTVREPSFKE